MKTGSFCIAAIVTAMLSGCAVLPGQSGDYGKFCDIGGKAQSGEIYRVSGVRDFWLTPAGNYLSDREFHDAGSSAFDEVSGLVTHTPGR